MIWVVATNSVVCRIFQYDKHPEKLTIIKKSDPPENRLKKEAFLTSDKPGHYKSSTSNRGAYAPRTDPKAVEIDNFARHTAQGWIDFSTCRQTRKDTVRNNIQKDPQNITGHELLSLLHTNAEFRD